MPARLAVALLLAAGLPGCIAYEYEHEFWLRVDGSGSVSITGRPELWTAFKGLGRPEGPGATATRVAARSLIERSSLRVRRVALTSRAGRPYLSVTADFDDVNRLSASAAFPDLHIALRREGDRLRLEGRWQRPATAPTAATRDDGGLLAVRFHLPSKVYDHQNAFAGVERGNIVGWRQELRQGLAGEALDFGATLDRHSILWSTVGLFGGAIALALAMLGTVLCFAFLKGKKKSTRRGTPGVCQ